MTVTATATQTSTATVDVAWATDDVDPVAGWSITRELNPPDTPGLIATLTNPAARAYVDPAQPGAVGDVVRYTVTDLDSSLFGVADVTITNQVLTYVTIAEVKAALGITNTDHDDAVTRAATAAQGVINAKLGTAISLSPVPTQVAQATLILAVRLYKRPDAPFGLAGGPLELGDTAITEMDPDVEHLLMGFHVTYGVG